MTPEELKDKWRRLNASDAGNDAAQRRNSRPSFYDDRMIDNVTSGRVTSARERLMGRYRMMFAGVAPAGMMCSLPMARLLPWWGLVGVMVFFVIAAVMDYYLYRGVKGIDLSVDGVEEVAAKVRFYRRRHHLFQLLLIPYAVFVVSLYFIYLGGGAVRWGLAVGVVVGLAIGLAVYLQMMRDYRQML